MVKDFKEKTITINLRRAYEKPVTKRARAALFVIKERVRKETRAENIKLSNLVNETIWEKGMYKPPRKIIVKVVQAKDGVDVYLVDEKLKVKAAESTKKGEKKAESKGDKVEAVKAEPKAKEKPKEKAASKEKKKTPVEPKVVKEEAKAESTQPSEEK